MGLEKLMERLNFSLSLKSVMQASNQLGLQFCFALCTFSFPQVSVSFGKPDKKILWECGPFQAFFGLKGVFIALILITRWPGLRSAADKKNFIFFFCWVVPSLVV
jgi:hypothetical protein